MRSECIITTIIKGKECVMITTQDCRMKKYIKKIIMSCCLTKQIYLCYQKRKFSIYKKHKIELMQKNGDYVIGIIQNLLSEKNIAFFFDMGTLLGIIREGKLLKHDMDIDVAVYVDSEKEKKDLRDFLLNRGCSLHKAFEVEGVGLVEESYIIESIKFDINYYIKRENKDLCYLLFRNPEKVYLDKSMDVVELTCDSIQSIEKTKFNGIDINIPKDAKQYLATRYGDNWSVPDKNYVYWQGNSARKVDKIGYCVLDSNLS